ncbi:MAG: gliding motility-associated C-terminal domain-containing protein, partial [Bacteroidota bacterium]|nr:gliding motility-associated C-terminal domain-containing protein [Bacteroidota bacterium]
IGLTVDLAAGEPIGWKEPLVSINMIDEGDGHRFGFRTTPQDLRNYGAVVGLRSEANQRIWSMWKVYNVGEQLIAEAISRNRTVTRIAVRSNDLFEIIFSDTSVEFLHNSRIVAVDSRVSQGPSRLSISLHSAGSIVREVWTTIPVPLLLNTAMLTDSIAVSSSTPAGLVQPFLSGTLTRLELDAQLTSETHIVTDPASQKILFELADGRPMQVRVTISSDTILLDSSLFEFRGINELILYDEPEVYIEPRTPPVRPELEHGMVMSPNDDQNYDEFVVMGVNVGDAFMISIHDLEENLLFQTTDPNLNWNGHFMNTGSLVDNGIYSYLIELNGESYAGQFMIKQ